MTTKQLIVRFLDLRHGTTIAGHILQVEVPIFSLNTFNKPILPSTIDRAWRELRTEGDSFLANNGYNVSEDLDYRGKEKRFIIRRSNEIHRDSKGQATK